MNKDIRYFLTDIIILSADLNFAIIGLDTPSLQSSGIDILNKHVCPLLYKLLKEMNNFEKAELIKDLCYKESCKALSEDIQHLTNCLNDQHFLKMIKGIEKFMEKIKLMLVELKNKLTE